MDYLQQFKDEMQARKWAEHRKRQIAVEIIMAAVIGIVLLISIMAIT